MNADSAFVIGRSHAVCQDYAVAGSIQNRSAVSYTIVADGCSSSPDTDIGARLLVKATQRLLLARESAESFESGVGELYNAACAAALQQARLIGLSSCAVDATLLTVLAIDGRVTAACHGDGTIALQSRNGDLHVYSISFEDGRPRYASYSHQPLRRKAFDDLSGNTKRVSHVRFTREGVVDLETRISVDEIEVFTGDASDYEYAAVLTDGVESFVRMAQTETTKQVERVESERILENLLGFRSFCGAFAKRRLSRFLTECNRKDWRNNDDLAVGVVYLGGEDRQ